MEELFNAHTMAKLTSQNDKRKYEVDKFISNMKKKIEDCARRGMSRCVWDSNADNEWFIDSCRTYFEARGFTIKDPHEYSNGVLQICEWIYW